MVNNKIIINKTKKEDVYNRNFCLLLLLYIPLEKNISFIFVYYIDVNDV